MKKISFLCGMPRAGNTILGALINQNKNVTLTANSIVPDILHESWKIKHNMSFQNFPDNNALDIYLENIVQNYYSSFKSNFIIDRGPWGTPGNIMLLQKYYKHPLKFIVLTRNVLECMASFVRITKKINKKKLEKECENLFKRDHIFGMNIWAIQNLIKETKINTNIKIHYVTYDNLINKPQEEIKKIFAFIEAPYEKIKETNFNDFEINGIKYNDLVYSDSFNDLHKIRTDSIKKNKIVISKILPKKIINKYKDAYIF
jgi:hypothetical protein